MHSDDVGQLMSTSRRGTRASSCLSFLAIAVTLVSAVGCSDVDGDGDDVAAVSDGLVLAPECQVRGSGTHTVDDLLFSGFADSDASLVVTGQWQHEFADGSVMRGVPDDMLCRINGAVIADFRGTAALDGVPGFTFEVHVEEVGTGAQLIESRTLTASRYYSPNGWDDDGWAEHTSFAVPVELPVSVGSGFKGKATLSFQRAEILDRVTCHYRSRVAPGDRYTIQHCRSDTAGTPPVVAGDVVDTLSVDLHVTKGAKRDADRAPLSQTTVALTLDVTTDGLPSGGDLLTVIVLDAMDVQVRRARGPLTRGDLIIDSPRLP